MGETKARKGLYRHIWMDGWFLIKKTLGLLQEKISTFVQISHFSTVALCCGETVKVTEAVCNCQARFTSHGLKQLNS